MCVSTVDGVKLPVVHLDGVYADTYTPFVTLLTALYPNQGFAEEIRNLPKPPWTAHIFATHLDLTDEAEEQMIQVIDGIPNYWAAVPKRLAYVAVGDEVAVGPEEQVVFYVDRQGTRGLPVLDQTIKWIRRELGIPSPIVWVADAS